MNVTILVLESQTLMILVASHYGQRLRGHQFPSITLQEIKNSTSQPFALTLRTNDQNPKAVILQNTYMGVLLIKATNSQ